MLKMIYFFQVLPFYLLQFCSGMGVGEFIQYILHKALITPTPEVTVLKTLSLDRLAG
jgi:hypothetical protein